MVQTGVRRCSLRWVVPPRQHTLDNRSDRASVVRARHCRTPSGIFPPLGARRSLHVNCSSAEGWTAASESNDLNVLQTALREAVDREQYPEAAKLRDQISKLGGGCNQKDWRALGLPEWLADRAERCGYRFPTAVQAAVLEEMLHEDFEQRKDVLIQARTGSGKSLAFVLPMLAALSESLYAVEMIRAQNGQKMLQPLALLVVPTRELGAQLALLTWRLLGGTVSNRGPGDEANMFTYIGPRNVRVVGVLDEADVERTRTDVEGGGLLQGVQIVVGLPKHLAQVVKNGDLELERLRFVAVDELDLCLAQGSDNVQRLLELNDNCNLTRQVALAGATLPENTFDVCVEKQWIVNQPVRIGEVDPHNLGRALPPALRHRQIQVPDERKLLVLCQLVREDTAEHAERTDGDQPLDESEATPACKVVVFCQTEPQALKLAERLRRALWGVHRVVVGVSGGYEPLKALEAFRDGRASLLCATANSARGLDLQGVTHVYSVAPPANIEEYVHRAGRAGRIGNSVRGGLITTLTDPALDEHTVLQEMAATLDLHLATESAPLTQSLSALAGLDADDSSTDADAQAGEPAGEEGPERSAAASEAIARRLTDLYQLMDAQGAPLLEQKPKEPLSLAEELLERELNQAPAESLTGALWERVAGSEAVDSPFKLNDVRKARSANKFVGDGCAGSCTDMYRRATGDLGNCSSYLETDVVYVSVNGDCEGRVRAVDAQGFLTGLYRDEILLAAAAGATLITDRESDRGNGYNIGEMEVAAALARECHYMEKRDEYGGTGVWTPQSGNSRDQDQDDNSCDNGPTE